MMPGLRRFMLFVHLSVSVGWIGAVVGYVVLDVVAVTGQDAELVRASFLAMRLTVWYAIVPLALAALLTGLVMSLGTPWGLFRHYWVLISLALTILTTGVLLLETRTIDAMAAVAASGADPRGLPGSLPHSVGGLVVLLVIAALNVFKPRGLTPYGWRKQEEERLERQSSPSGQERD